MLLLVAILMSWFGGLAGSFAGGLSLPLMLLFFGLAHLAYIWLYGRRLASKRVPLWALVYVVWLIGILVVLWPHLGRLAIAVAIYGVVLAGTAIASTRGNALIAWGGALFLASDTFLSLVIFMPTAVDGWGFLLAMLTYDGGQGLLALGAVLAMRARRLDAGAPDEQGTPVGAWTVPVVGVEPTRPLGQPILSRSRLPFRHTGLCVRRPHPGVAASRRYRRIQG